MRKGKGTEKDFVIHLYGDNVRKWVVRLMSHTGAVSYAQAIRALLYVANRLIELDVNPLSVPDLIKEYRKNISKLQTELAKVIEMLNSIPKSQQVININGETVNIGTLADKIENIH